MKKFKIRILIYRYEFIYRFRTRPRSRSWLPKHYNNIETYSDIIKEKYF